jgi:protein TonB
MLDLPQAPAPAPQFPVTDLPPGPEVPAVEQAPPPKEETKPPEQFTEVTLQEPEPPKPQQSVEATAPPPSIAIAVPDEKPPTAGSEVEPSSAAVREWQSSLSALFRGLQRYPSKAIARREHGSAEISVRIDSDGRVIESHITKSSGSRDLDEEMFALVARAQKRLPKPPPNIKEKDLEIIFAQNFSFK